MSDRGGNSVGTEQAVFGAGFIAIAFLFSYGLACVTPFAALATIAGRSFNRTAAAAIVIVAWLLNQAVGYGLLDYPRTWDSFAWGGAIGIASLAGLALARLPVLKKAPQPLAISAAFVGAFCAYEATLYAATWFLPSEPVAFALPVVAEVFVMNALALAILTLARWLAVKFGTRIGVRGASIASA